MGSWSLVTISALLSVVLNIQLSVLRCLFFSHDLLRCWDVRDDASVADVVVVACTGANSMVWLDSGQCLSPAAVGPLAEGVRVPIVDDNGRIRARGLEGPRERCHSAHTRGPQGGAKGDVASVAEGKPLLHAWGGVSGAPGRAQVRIL